MEVEEKDSILVRRTFLGRRRGRFLMLLLLLFFLLLSAGIGVVIGYFIGRKAERCEYVKTASAADKNVLKPEDSRKDAVESVSREHLKDFLK